MQVNISGRRLLLAVLGLAITVGLLGWGPPAHGQKLKKNPVFQPFLPGGPGTQPETPPATSSQFSAIKLEEKSEYRQVINLARDKIIDKDWVDAAKAIQNILDLKENFYVQVREKDAHNKETLRWTSIKFEANNLLSQMPDEGLDIYELHSGAQAKDRLDEAKRTGDRNLLKEVALTYMYTKAGIEANDLLATYFLDRGDFFMAALRLEKLLAMNPERAKLSDLTLFKAALAYNRAGDKKNSDIAFQRLEPRLREQGGLKVNGEVVPVARLIDILGEKVAPLFNPNDWPMIRGNNTNSAQATGSQPLLDASEIIAIRPTVLDKEEGGGLAGQIAADRLRDAINHQRGLANSPVMSGSFPIAANKLAIYRSYRDLRAVYLYNGKDPLGQDATIGKIFWQTRDFDGALTPILENSRYRSTLDGWIQQFGAAPGFRSLLYENSLLGTISTDHRLVYAVDDLAVPAPGNMLQFMFQQQNVAPELRTLLMQNSLYAVNINTGKYEWRLGVGKSDDLFAESHFLGVPISVGGNLWVLNEKNGGQNTGDAELRLVCIDPNKLSAPGRPTIVGKIEKLGLVQQQHRFTHDVSRRTNAVHLAYADGVLVCPTNAGEVLGVDLLTQSLAWSYPYREQAMNNNVNGGLNPFNPRPFPGPFPGANMPLSIHPANWKSAPPVIQNGKVVFTAPDANSVHCISLRDGKPVWKKKQMDGDLFLAGVFDGKVLIAGRNTLRALNLEDGAQLWSLATGNMPSGQGVASKNIYYLPLQKGEILAVDIERGIIKAHNRAKSGSNPDLDPGNLVYCEGTVLSQTPMQLVIYPQLTAKLDLVTKQLDADPTNLEKLVTRGELLFADGQVQPAVDCLQLALTKNLTPELKTRARDKLYEALTDLLQTDFKTAGAKYLKDYREFCNVPDAAEQQQRLAKYFRIAGQGYEDQRDLVKAFEMFGEFGALPSIRKDGVPSPDDPMHKVPINVWLRGRIAGMMARAKPDERLPLENKIAEEWKLVKAKKELDAIRTFVDMFDVPFAVGREARLYLAEAIVDRNDRPAFLEAELNLQQLRGSDYFEDARISARALAALAKLEEKKNSTESMKLAAAYYRELRRDYPKVPLADGKTTGADLFDQLATDPRFLPYLEEPGPLWSKEKIAARELKEFNGGLQGFVFQPEGDLNPLMKQHRLVLDLSTAPNPQLRLYNFGTGAVRWTQSLGVGGGQNNFQYFQYLYQQGQNNLRYYPNARFRFYQVRGNLAVFQVGAIAYCLDMDSARILWQHNLVENMPTQQPGMIIQQVLPDADGNLQIMVWNQMNGQRTTMPIGHVGAVQASYVALVTQKGLTVVDPLRGSVLWRKLDVAVRTRVFGDDQYLFLVDEAEGGAIGVGRAMRAIDGAPVATAPDFSGVYQGKIRIMGRKILAAVPSPNKLTVKLYDILSGKDVWSKEFHPKAVVLATEDANLTGVIEPNGMVTALEVDSGRVVLNTQAIVGRVTAEDVATVNEPLLLQDRDRFYLALNQPLDGNKVSGNLIFNNFSNGLRCRTVNGWLLAFFREDGKHLENGVAMEHKRGDFHWHTSKKLDNQMIVLEQFEQLPVIVLSARYNEPINGGGGGTRWLSNTKCLLRSNGKAIYDPGPRATAGMGSAFSTFSVDPKEGTINLISSGQGNPSVQMYVDDDRKPVQGGALTPPGAGNVGAPPQAGVVPPPFGNPGLRDVLVPPPGRIIVAPQFIPPPAPEKQ